MFNYVYFLKIILLINILLICYGCTPVKPPLELAPNGEIVEKALYLQLEKKYYYLQKSLQTKPIKLEITAINVEQIKPFFRDNLPLYHLQGNYHLNLQLKNQKITQINKPFDIYLQRQKQGKTWRLISAKNLQ
jgi:hypothetical protein